MQELIKANGCDPLWGACNNPRLPLVTDLVIFRGAATCLHDHPHLCAQIIAISFGVSARLSTLAHARAHSMSRSSLRSAGSRVMPFFGKGTSGRAAMMLGSMMVFPPPEAKIACDATAKDCELPRRDWSGVVVVALAAEDGVEDAIDASVTAAGDVVDAAAAVAVIPFWVPDPPPALVDPPPVPVEVR